MPYKLNGTYYTFSEVAEELGVKMPTMSLYITRGGYKKTNFGGKRGGMCLIHEDEVECIRRDFKSRQLEKHHSLKVAARKLGCSIYDLILNAPSVRKNSGDEAAWRIPAGDVKIIAALKDSKTSKIDWKKVKAVLSALHRDEQDTGE